MTDDPDEFDINDMGEALARYRNRDHTPQDVVPPKGLDRAAVLALNKSALKPVSFSDPDTDVELDDDGMPKGVNPPTVAMLGRSTFLRSTLARLGISPEEVPNLHVIDD